MTTKYAVYQTPEYILIILYISVLVLSIWFFGYKKSTTIFVIADVTHHKDEMVSGLCGSLNPDYAHVPHLAEEHIQHNVSNLSLEYLVFSNYD